MKVKNKKLLIVPGTSFVRAYAGTEYLINELLEIGIDARIIIRCQQEEFKEYRNLPFKIQIFVQRFKQYPLLRKLETMIFFLFLLLKMLTFKSILITESSYLKLTYIIKKIKPSILIIQYCQELLVLEDYPDNKIAQIYARYFKIPNVVIDVEPHRAAERKKIFGLKQVPYVLMNTMPLKNILPSAPLGTLAKLAGVEIPKGIPILLHAGGIGKEKPLERIIDAVALCEKEVFFLAFCSGKNEEIQKLSNYANTKLKNGKFHICKSISRTKLMPSMHEADIGVIDYSYSIEPTLNQKYCAPTKLFEFMAYGLILLGSNNNSLRDIIEKDNIGFCALDDSVEAISAALSKILGLNTKTLLEKKTNSKDIFVRKYSYEMLCSPVIREIAKSYKLN